VAILTVIHFRHKNQTSLVLRFNLTKTGSREPNPWSQRLSTKIQKISQNEYE